MQPSSAQRDALKVSASPPADAAGASPGRAARLPALTDEQQELVRQHIGLVGVHLRNRVPTPRQPMRQREYDDLFQEGCLALVRAAARFNPKRDGLFAAYALPRIRGAVHLAIHDRFTLVHIPVRAARRAREQPADITRPPIHVLEINPELEQSMTVEHRSAQPSDSIRHAIRRRYELAVRRTLEQMRRRIWRHRNPCAIMARIAEERMLIGAEQHRTALRQIARDFNVSSGRASEYERNFVAAVTGTFEKDPQVIALLEMAREDADGQDGIVDASRRNRLYQAEVAAFEQKFIQMGEPDRAQAIYSLLERSTDCLPEVARNLFRLTLSASEEDVRTVA